ncbi:hypothetical protein C0J52_02463 [Blattella germanica]|nr:hypothetical protein C0J52_02463 [Blattella germanica]
MIVEARALGRRFELQLRPSPALLDPQFVLLSRWRNHTEMLPSHLAEQNCFFRSDATHRAAVALCGGMRGIITSPENEYYVVNPLPRRFRRRSTDVPHVIVRWTPPAFAARNAETSHISHNYQTNELSEATLSQSSQIPTDYTQGNTAMASSINDEVNRTLLEQSRNTIRLTADTKSFNNGNVPERNVVHDVQNSSSSNKKDRLIHYSIDKELVTYETNSINAYVSPSVTNQSESVSETSKNSESGRTIDIPAASSKTNERTSEGSHTCETCSETILKRSKRTTMLLPGAPIHVETAVFVDKDLYRHMALNFPTDTERELVRVQLLYHDPSLGRQVNFVLKRLEILHVDPANLQRPHDIDRFLSLAPVAGMCTATSSCTVNEGRHFESVLGMRHDGPLAENECDPGSYIMSPTLGSGKITWSSCSRRYLQLFLETSQSQCLLDHSSSGGQLDHSAEGTLPGERFNADQQCMLKYGRGSIHATQQPLDDVCRDLHCQRDRYTWTSHPALEGTFCGNNKWCRSGRCVGRGLSALQAGYSPNQRVDGGWSSDRRFRTCFAEQCGNVQRTTIRDFADQICMRAREVDTELLGTGLQRISSDEMVVPKVEDGHFLMVLHAKVIAHVMGNPCIVSVEDEFVCDNYDAATFSTELEQCPGLTRGGGRLQVRDSSLFSRNKGRRREVPEARTLWSPASGCHFNCLAPGRGLRLVVAKDMKCRLEDNCEGGSVTSIQLCEPDKLGCGRLKTPFEHATTVCSKYRERVRRLSGFGMQISPVACKFLNYISYPNKFM